MKAIWRHGLVLALSLLSATALALEPVRAGQENSLIRAFHAEGRLWLLSDAGQLASLAEADGKILAEDAGEPVHDMCVAEGQLLVLTATGNKPQSWNLRRHAAQGWSAPIPIATRGEGLVALFCEGGDALVVTNARLLSISGKQINELALKGEMTRGVASALVTGDAVYMGFNYGEWGGGLKKIDRSTGNVVQIENITGALCGGLLNTRCDPVNGLAVLPWRKDCVAAAIGLMHMLADGRIVTVCDDRIEQLYVKPYAEAFPDADFKLAQTIPFYGLLPVEGKLMAVGANGLYTLSADGTVAFEKMPAFRSFGPFQVSFAQTGIILVLTTINQRRSVSGPVPMMVAR